MTKKSGWHIYTTIHKVLWSGLEFRSKLLQPELFSINILTPQIYSYWVKGKRFVHGRPHNERVTLKNAWGGLGQVDMGDEHVR